MGAERGTGVLGGPRVRLATSGGKGVYVCTRKRGIALTIVALGAAGVAGPVAGQEAPRPGELQLAACARGDLVPPARCGTFTVWENREAKTGRVIHLNVVLLAATGARPQPDPVVVLVGGPGQAATAQGPGLSRSALREDRDILLVDQRGTGASNGLYCSPPPDAPLQAFMPTMDAGEVRACRTVLEQRAELRYYLTSLAMDDLDDLRAALGYEKINLQGGSYGTRAALVYIRRHGEHVRSARLQGAVAFGHPMPSRFAQDAQASLGNVLRDCAAEAACAAAFPSLEADYRRAVRGTEEAPIRLRVRDPRTADSVEVTFGAADFAESLRAMLYTPNATRRIPLLLHHAAATGDYRPFVEFQLDRNLGLARGIAEGMYFAVSCTEDVARVDPEAVYASGRDTFLADHRARPHIEGCDGWPPGRLPAGFAEEVESDVPVLLITGANDPVTPPASATLAASRLHHARVVIVPGGGHGLGGLVGAACLDRLMDEFLRTADPANLDTSCVAAVRRAPFVLSLAGSRDGLL